MKKDNFKLNRNHFIKFLVRNKIYEIFVQACQKENTVYDKQCNLEEIMSDDRALQDAFNWPLSWSRTEEGWNFWANVSYKWKRYIVKHQLVTLESIYFFETDHETFYTIENLTEYLAQNKKI